MRILNGCKLFALIATFYASLMSASVNAMSEDSEMTVDTLVAEHISDKYLAYCFIGNFDGSASVKSITRLDCGNRQIKNINGLEHLAQLNDLKLYTNQISDLSPLANLTQLSFLSLQGNNVSDLSPIKNLLNLNELVLSHNQIESILPLEKMLELKTLNLRNNNISDLLPLADLRKLWSVNLVNNDKLTCVDNVSDNSYSYKDLASTCLKKGPEHWVLDIPDPNLAKCLTSTFYYDVSDVKDVGCGNGKDSKHSIFDLEGIQTFTELLELRLWAHPVSDISALTKLEKLQRLYLNRSPVTDVSVLNSLTELSVLSIDNHPNFNLSSLSLLTQLRGLEIGGSEIKDLSFLSTLTQLSSLTITAPLAAGIDLSPLASLVNLRNIEFDFPRSENVNELYSDLSPLTNLFNLKTLDLGNLEVDNLSVLAPLTQLKKLLLTAPKQKELDAFSQFKNLWFLSISSGQITDISGLKALNNLNKISLFNKDTPLECMGDAFIVDYSLEEIQLENGQFTKAGEGPTTEFSLSHGDINEKCWDPELTIEFALDQVKDESLRSCISDEAQNKALSSPFDIIKLECPSLAIQSLDGLGLFKNLSSLDVSDNSLSEIRELNSLENLYQVKLSQNEQLDCLDSRDGEFTPYHLIPKLCLVSKIIDVPHSDGNLKACINQASKDNNWQLVDDVTSLDCRDAGINNIEALAFFPNLTSLNLADNRIWPLSVISNLHQLNSLDVSSNGVGDLSFLSSLTGLKRFSLGEHSWLNESDLDFLSSLTKLEHFSAEIYKATHIEYLSRFGFFEKLKSLSLHFKFNDPDIRWSNLAALGGAVELEKLSLYGSAFTDLSPLYNLRNLSSLVISKHRQHISCLTADFYKTVGATFSEFNGSYQDIPDSCWASHKTMDEVLPLIEDDNLKACINEHVTTKNLNLGKDLVSLSCTNRSIKTLSGLAYLPSLIDLDLSDNSIADIKDLNSLVSLESLNLVNNPVSNLLPLSRLYKLVDFRIKASHLAGISISNNCYFDENSVSYFGISSSCFDNDYDDDGIVNILDNCPERRNENQLNTDAANDGGDVCDSDDDNDGMPDEYETFYGLNPLVADGDNDFDNDGLSNKQEFDVLSLPTVPDSDQDGIMDGDDDSPYIMTVSELLSSPAFTLSESLKRCLWDYDAAHPILDIETLDCTEPLASLLGIEYLKNLSSLYLGYGPAIMDVAEIDKLNKLNKVRTLSLRAEKVIDFTPLENLQHIESLVIINNKVSVLAHVANLNQLSSLTVNVLPSDDLSVLANMAKLSELNLFANNISLVGDLSGLSHLESLSINADLISELSGLSGLMNLMTLNLSVGQLPSDLSQIQNLKQLENLSLPNMGLSNLEFVKGLDELRKLSVPYNQIIDLRPLINLRKLESLDVSNNPDVDIRSLEGFSALKTLYISGVDLNTIRPITNISNLSVLSVDVDDLLNLDELALLSTLSELTIKAEQITHLSFLDYLPQLTSLNIWATPPQDMSSISSLGNLQVLAIFDGSGSDVKVDFDLAIVADLEELHTLRFDSLNVSNEAQLENLRKLTDFSIRNSDVFSDCFGWDSINNLSYADIPEYCFFVDVEEEVIDDENMSISRLLTHIPNFALSQCISMSAEYNGWSTANEITHLHCSFKEGLDNLEGLQWLTSLQSLGMGGTNISDLGPLAELNELEAVSLWSTPNLTSLAPLYNLPKLYQLSLDLNDPWLDNELLSFPHLSSLFLADGENIDTSVLNRLTALTELDIWRKAPNDLSFLNSLSNLNVLRLDGRKSSLDYNSLELSALGNLVNLTELSLVNMAISDVGYLANLTSLESLSLYGNEITNISALAELSDLKELSLGSNDLDDISVLSNLTNLTWLALHSNSINDISAISKLTQLTNLYLDSNDLSDISSLTNLNNLISLELSDNDHIIYADFTPPPNLSQLSLNDNSISDINFLSEFTQLEALSLSNNQVFDISALHNLTALTDLNLEDNLIVDVSALKRIYQTADIELYGNPIMTCGEGYDGEEKSYNALPESCWSADTDSDSISNTVDNCPAFANPAQWDKDQDGLGNECDDDIDGDGFSNKEEEAVGSKVWDFESTPESILLDDDGDGINNLEDNCIAIANPKQWDKDKDGLGNECDDDIDGDGVSNVDEEVAGTRVWNEFSFPGQSIEKDRDQDGFSNESDNCPDIFNQGQWDKDKDGLGNECDDDIDGDGYPNQYEIDAGSLAWDANSIPSHHALLDDDHDTIFNGVDNCRITPNKGQWDRDGDGIGNKCDGDIDGDGALNHIEIGMGTSPWDPDSRPSDYDLLDNDRDNLVNGLDNCPNIANPEQHDFDEDNIGNVCDDDFDGDGFTKQEEIDSGTDPRDPQSFPLPSDMDADGYLDSEDTCPTIYNTNQSDFDNDGIGNICDDDIDGDGFSNTEERERLTDVWDASSFPQ